MTKNPTPHSIEGVVEKFWKMLSANQFIKSTNSVTDEVEEYPPAIVDMEATVAINGEFDKYAIDEWLTTVEQEAREIDPVRVGMLRQWINEDRIINNPHQVLISNGDILYWLTGDEKYLSHTDDNIATP